MPDLSRLRCAAALSAAAALLAAALPAAASPLSPQTRQALATRREQVRKWAPICANGALGLTQPPECGQGDMLEYSGMSCAMGDRARCNDVKRSQGPDGRWWRNPSAVGHEDVDAFSRDMLMGVLDYVLVTGDKAAFERFLDYVHAHGNKMCPKASDNRCHLVPDTWGLVGFVMKKLGIHRPWLIVVAEATVDASLFVTANTAPLGYMLELVAHNIITRRLIGQNSGAMREAARRMAKRQENNPLFVYLHEGATEQAAKLALEICQPTMGKWPGDIFFQRRLERNAQGIYVIRDWHEPVPPLAREIASGNDCMIVLNALLK